MSLLIPVTADAVSVTPVPVAALGVNVVAVVFVGRYGPSFKTALFIDVSVHEVFAERESFRGVCSGCVKNNTSADCTLLI